MRVEEIVEKLESRDQRMIFDIVFTNVVTKCRPENKIVTFEVIHKKSKKYKIIEKINSSISSIIVTNGTVTWIYKPQKNSVTIFKKAPCGGKISD